MASNFKPWVDSPTAGQQVQSASVFATDAQRVDGFKAGDPASALRVNSALRQANIVVAGLMQMCDDIKTLPSDLSLISTVTQVKNAIKAAIDELDATVLASAKSYTDTREGVINGKITNIQNQVTSNKNRLDALEPSVATIDGNYPTLTAGKLSSFVVKGRSTTSIGWHKAMEIKAVNIGNTGGAGYSALVLVNGVRGSTGESVTPAGSSIIEIDCRADNATNGVFLTGYLRINILNGWLDTKDICAVLSEDNTTISIYINIKKQFMQYNLTKLSEGAEAVENVNALTFVDEYYGSSAPDNAVYAEILNNATYAGKAGELTFVSVGTTATSNNNWYEIATVPVNANNFDAFSIILLLNGRKISEQMSGIVELEGRCEPNNWTYKKFKTLCGNLVSTHIAYWEDTNKTLHFYLWAPSTVYAISTISAQKGTALNITFPLTLYQPEELPTGLIYGANFNFAGYDSQSNCIPDTYAKIKDVSNPNLLINPDFSINTKGQTSYSGSGKETVDKWITSALTSVVTQTDGKWTFAISDVTKAASRTAIYQYVEDFEKFIGKTVTASIKVNAITEDVSRTVVLNIFDGAEFQEVTLTGTGVFSITKIINENATMLRVSISGKNSALNYSVTPEWIKLEIGSVATAFTPPLIVEELWKCTNLKKSTAFPTSESQTSETNVLSEKAVYNNFVLSNKQQYLRDNYFAVTEKGKYGMFFESSRLTTSWDSISMTFMLSNKNALNNTISTTIYELAYRANGTNECTVVLRRITGDNQADYRLYVDFVNTAYAANSNYFRLYYLSTYTGDDSRMFTLLNYSTRYGANYFDYTTYSGNLTLVNSISSIGTTTHFSSIVSSTYETPSNKTTSISSASTDSQYPSAKAVYSYVNATSNPIRYWERFTEFSNNGFGLKFPEWATYILILFLNGTYYQFTVDINASPSWNMAFWTYVGEAGGYKFYMDTDTSENGYGRGVLIARDFNNAEVKLSDIMNLPYYHKIAN